MLKLFAIISSFIILVYFSVNFFTEAEEHDYKVLKVIDIEDKAAYDYAWRSTLICSGTGQYFYGDRTNCRKFDVSSIFANNVKFNPANGETMRLETVPYIGNTLTFSGTGNVKTVTEVNFDSDVPHNKILC